MLHKILMNLKQQLFQIYVVNHLLSVQASTQIKIVIKNQIHGIKYHLIIKLMDQLGKLTKNKRTQIKIMIVIVQLKKHSKKIKN